MRIVSSSDRSYEYSLPYRDISHLITYSSNMINKYYGSFMVSANKLYPSTFDALTYSIKGEKDGERGEYRYRFDISYHDHTIVDYDKVLKKPLDFQKAIIQLFYYYDDDQHEQPSIDSSIADKFYPFTITSKGHTTYFEDGIGRGMHVDQKYIGDSLDDIIMIDVAHSFFDNRVKGHGSAYNYTAYTARVLVLIIIRVSNVVTNIRKGVDKELEVHPNWDIYASYDFTQLYYAYRKSLIAINILKATDVIYLLEVEYERLKRSKRIKPKKSCEVFDRFKDTIAFLEKGEEYLNSGVKQLLDYLTNIKDIIKIESNDETRLLTITTRSMRKYHPLDKIFENKYRELYGTKGMVKRQFEETDTERIAGFWRYRSMMNNLMHRFMSGLFNYKLNRHYIPRKHAANLLRFHSQVNQSTVFNKYFVGWVETYFEVIRLKDGARRLIKLSLNNKSRIQSMVHKDSKNNILFITINEYEEPANQYRTHLLAICIDEYLMDDETSSMRYKRITMFPTGTYPASTIDNNKVVLIYKQSNEIVIEVFECEDLKTLDYKLTSRRQLKDYLQGISTDEYDNLLKRSAYFNSHGQRVLTLNKEDVLLQWTQYSNNYKDISIELYAFSLKRYQPTQKAGNHDVSIQGGDKSYSMASILVPKRQDNKDRNMNHSNVSFHYKNAIYYMMYTSVPIHYIVYKYYKNKLTCMTNGMVHDKRFNKRMMRSFLYNQNDYVLPHISLDETDGSFFIYRLDNVRSDNKIYTIRINKMKFM